jgi:hypothetical protein
MITPDNHDLLLHEIKLLDMANRDLSNRVFYLEKQFALFQEQFISQNATVTSNKNLDQFLATSTEIKEANRKKRERLDE